MVSLYEMFLIVLIEFYHHHRVVIIDHTISTDKNVE